ncbi:hypothetical protein EMIHUDRAFT_220179 [Emiliania huxleyi CCMP1516]|uniref:Uncharacterized protein n=2 Tax=Emiliania huxleyi TaxID=2903 RepID=A0A0D3I1G8_EMIH1|nr:hypothetical protein EMIHUDRAFT_220179 [Emiliania huxleyi CCMP1516]EOD05103.1 hypothetical protein EMIHUDRAFT_220179 [Emiliania huxleyi CCMP1516]|eukprot:XP_005757532.1 hypothetical protein EMIHUDRAFT_220179 [Emiliania huxleyi CCMP1516]
MSMNALWREWGRLELTSLPAGYRVAGLASGRGWAHLAEFASRWVGICVSFRSANGRPLLRNADAFTQFSPADNAV